MDEPGEVVFLQEFYVKITDRRTIIGTVTYSMAEVTSVHLTSVAKSRRPLLLIIPGLLLIGWAVIDQTRQFLPLFVIGSALCLVGISLFMSAKPTYAVIIDDPAGARSILRSSDPVFMQSIVDAMNSAVAYRRQMEQTKTKVVRRKRREHIKPAKN